MLAIIIPYYKINFFEETLASLAAQTNRKFNVYIGDDNSPDDPSELINRFSSRLNITYKKFDKNLGSKSLVKQWERCCAMMDNEQWMMILGDDDSLGKDVVKDFYDNLDLIRKSKTTVVKFPTVLIDEEDNTFADKPTLPHALNSYFFYKQKMNGNARSSLSEHIFSVEVFKKFGFRDYPLAWHSDDMAWLQFTSFGDFFCINSSFVRVRISILSISGNQENKKLKENALMMFYEDLVFRFKDQLSKTDIVYFLRIIEGYEKYNQKKRNFRKRLFLYWKYGGAIKAVKFIKYVIKG